MNEAEALGLVVVAVGDDSGGIHLAVSLELLAKLIFGEIVALLFSAIILVYGGFTVSSLAMGQQTSSLWGLAVGTFYWVMPVCGILMVIYSAMNIVAIAKGESEAALDEAAAALAKAEAEKEA